MCLESRELRLIPYPRENLLTNGAHDLNSLCVNQSPQFLRLGSQETVPTPQRQRPNTGINQNPHARARCRL